MNKTLKCFISSSVEDLPVVNRLVDFLQSEGVESVRWDRGIFEPGMSIFENLQNTISEVDFVIALIPSQKDTRSRTRENVMFEMGLIIGMGKPLIPLIRKAPDVKFPSDMIGIMYLQYEPTHIETSFHYIKNWIARFLEN